MSPNENYLIPIALVENLHNAINLLYENVMEISYKCHSDMLCKHMMIDFGFVNYEMNCIKKYDIDSQNRCPIPDGLLEDLCDFVGYLWEDCCEYKTTLINSGVDFRSLLDNLVSIREILFLIYECDSVPIE